MEGCGAAEEGGGGGGGGEGRGRGGGVEVEVEGEEGEFLAVWGGVGAVHVGCGCFGFF